MAVVWAPGLVKVCTLAPLLGSIDWTSPGLPMATCTRPVAGLTKVTSGPPAIGQVLRTGARLRVDLNHRTVVAGDIQATALVVDFEPMGSADRERPVRHFVECRKLGDKNHRRLSDGEKHPGRGSVGYAPARLSRQSQRMLLVVVETKGAKLRAVRVIPDAGRNRQLSPGNDGNAIGPVAGVEYRPVWRDYWHRPTTGSPTRGW